MTAPLIEDRRLPFLRLMGFAIVLTVVSWALGAFAAAPWRASAPESAMIRIAFKHVAGFEQPDAPPSREEIERLPRHMRPKDPQRAQTGRRVDTELRVAIDGRMRLAKRYAPGGLRRDGPTFAYEELPILAGRRVLEVTLADGTADHAASLAARQWHLQQEVGDREGPGTSGGVLRGHRAHGPLLAMTATIALRTPGPTSRSQSRVLSCPP